MYLLKVWDVIYEERSNVSKSMIVTQWMNEMDVIQ